jgi:hypothetical protein
MKRSLLGALVVVVGLTIPAAGQSNPQKFTGHLVDAVCAGNHATEPGYAEKHDKACNLMDGCIKSGYSLILADHKVLKFDPKGAEQALAFIKATNKDKDLKVIVTGTVEGQTLTVKSIALDPSSH